MGTQHLITLSDSSYTTQSTLNSHLNTFPKGRGSQTMSYFAFNSYVVYVHAFFFFFIIISLSYDRAPFGPGHPRAVMKLAFTKTLNRSLTYYSFC